MAYRRYFGDTYTYGAAIIAYAYPDYMFLSAHEEFLLRRDLAQAAKNGRTTVLKLMARNLWREEFTAKLLEEEW